MNDGSTRHWSKDFVEHLRSVHFALIGVSASLIVLVGPSKDYDPRLASRQIEEVIRLQKEWSAQWAIAHLDWEAVSVAACEYPLRKHVLVIDVSLDSEQIVAGMAQPIASRNRRERNFRLAFPRPSWFQPGKFGRKTGVMTDLDRIPSTKSGFQDWWDGLNTYNPTVYLPLEVCSQAPVLVAMGSHETPSVASIWIESAAGQSHLEASLQATVATLPGGPMRFGYAFELSKTEAVIFPFATLWKLPLNQNVVVNHFRSWRTGPFKQAFYDLDQASLDFGSWELEDIERHLAEDAAKVDVFEVWGIKIPTQHLTFGGVGVLLCIQLYLMIYLRRLSGKLGEKDVGWDVPWIGMEPSKLARCVFLASLALPVIAIYLLVWHGVFIHFSHSHQSNSRGVEASWLPVVKVMGITAILASAVLGYYSWRFCPTVEAAQTVNTSGEPVRGGTEQPSATPAPLPALAEATSETPEEPPGGVGSA